MDVTIAAGLLLSISFRACLGQLCNGTEIFGEDPVSDRTGNVDTSNGTSVGYMLNHNEYAVSCCGIAKKWNVEYDTQETPGDIYFQIWRLTSGTTYKLEAEYSLSLSSPTSGTKLKATQGNKITVLPGDRIGWWSSDAKYVTYNSDANVTGGNLELDPMEDLTAGDTQDWSGATSLDSRAYGINLEVDVNSAPTYSNLVWATTLTDPAVGTNVDAITVTDIDVSDASALSVTMTSHAMFSFDSSTLNVTTAAVFSTNSTEVLEFVTSDLCGNNATATYNVIIIVTASSATVDNNDSGYFDDGRNLGWFIPTVCMTVAIAAALGWLAYTRKATSGLTWGGLRRKFNEKILRRTASVNGESQDKVKQNGKSETGTTSNGQAHGNGPGNHPDTGNGSSSVRSGADITIVEL